jgi:hypothetical protein
MSTATAPRPHTIATARINTSARMVLYRDFIIQEAHDTKSGKDVWEWTHQDYDRVSFPVTGDCQTIYECIDAVNEWHDNRDEAAYLDRQQSLMESGGPDNSAYSRDMIAAGRGHLLGGR